MTRFLEFISKKVIIIKVKLGLILLLLIVFFVVGCSSDSYSTTMYFNQIIDSDNNHRLLTIRSFRGTRTESFTVSEGSEILFSGTTEQGEIEFKLKSPEGELILSTLISPEKESEKTISGPWKAGTYSFELKAKEAKGVRIELVFKR